MNFRTTLIIIVLLAGIGGAYYLFFQKPSEQAAENEKPPIHQVYGVPRDAVQQVEIAFADAAYQDLKLVKDTTDNWQFTKPFQADADSEKVSQMLDDILNKRVKQTLVGARFSHPSELAQYGLETPSITLSLWTKGGSPTATFRIGKKAINFSVYVKENSEAHIFLIESSALDDLTKSPTDLRDRSVLKFNPETVSGIQFRHREAGTTSQSNTIHCEKRDGTWHVIHPLKAKADTQEIEGPSFGIALAKGVNL